MTTYFSEFASEALHIVIFKTFIKSMTSWLSELKVTPSFCFAFKILDDVTATKQELKVFAKVDAPYLTHDMAMIQTLFNSSKWNMGDILPFRA
jgi:hypothetical protein